MPACIHALWQEASRLVAIELFDGLTHLVRIVGRSRANDEPIFPDTDVPRTPMNQRKRERLPEVVVHLTVNVTG